MIARKFLTKDINEFYEKSIYELGCFKKLPSKVEWNKIAKQKNLMSYTAIKNFSKKPFKNIYLKAHKQFHEELYMKNFRNKQEEL